MKGTLVVPSNIEAMLTGAWKAHQDRSGVITLTYTDNTTESRKADKPIDEFEGWFHIVGFVQGARVAVTVAEEFDWERDGDAPPKGDE